MINWYKSIQNDYSKYVTPQKAIVVTVQELVPQSSSSRIVFTQTKDISDNCREDLMKIAAEFTTPTDCLITSLHKPLTDSQKAKTSWNKLITEVSQSFQKSLENLIDQHQFNLEQLRMNEEKPLCFRNYLFVQDHLAKTYVATRLLNEAEGIYIELIEKLKSKIGQMKAGVKTDDSIDNICEDFRFPLLSLDDKVLDDFFNDVILSNGRIDAVSLFTYLFSLHLTIRCDSKNLNASAQGILSAIFQTNQTLHWVDLDTAIFNVEN